jgi:hypothetical protein
MVAIASLLVAASAAVILQPGIIHPLYTFRGGKLDPRDAGLYVWLNEVSPVLTRETTLEVGDNRDRSSSARVHLAAGDELPRRYEAYRGQ